MKTEIVFEELEYKGEIVDFVLDVIPIWGREPFDAHDLRGDLKTYYCQVIEGFIIDEFKIIYYNENNEKIAIEFAQDFSIMFKQGLTKNDIINELIRKEIG
jgi:hypothetical protein